MSYFRIIMPNYNNSEWLDKSIKSVTNQTFTDWSLVVVDDMSSDGSYLKAVDLVGDKGLVIPNSEKRWNGGSRNVGLNHYKDSEYTLFLDSDDWFANSEILQKLHDFIESHGKPDCIRLPFIIEHSGNQHLPVMLSDDNADKLVHSIFVACWTKCVKSELVVPFPENTLMEDVVHNIAQSDVIGYDVAVFNEPVVIYNKNNPNSCSAKENQDLQHGKWQSSMFRYMADLLDLELEHDYCKEHRDWRASVCLKNIKEDKYTQSVE